MTSFVRRLIDADVLEALEPVLGEEFLDDALDDAGDRAPGYTDPPLLASLLPILPIHRKRRRMCPTLSPPATLCPHGPRTP
jgi:hypothetical protein